MLNQVKGNMYDWVTHTWNTIKGECPHGCAYCYMKKWGPQPKLHFDEKELKTDLGEGNFIFVGSSCDMWAEVIDPLWILATIDHCKRFNNTYLFQSKDPARIYKLRHFLPPDIVVGTTIETNRIYPQMGNTPSPKDRAISMMNLTKYNRTMVTIEPILDFDLDILVTLIKMCKPQWVNIGANTNYKVKLPEPPPEKIYNLIKELRKFTKVKIKNNLKRLYK